MKLPCLIICAGSDMLLARRSGDAVDFGFSPGSCMAYDTWEEVIRNKLYYDQGRDIRR